MPIIVRSIFFAIGLLRCRHGHWAILSPEPPGELRRHVSVSLSRRLRIFLVRLIASVTTASDRVVTGTERRG
jgi:hypothetical protein